jgi:hypothetical protein
MPRREKPPAESTPAPRANHSTANETVASPAPDRLTVELSRSSLNEDRALTLLKQGDLTPEAIEQLSKHRTLMESRKVKRAIVAHPRTPRYLAVWLVRQLFTFDLMQVALLASLAGDLKIAAEDALIKRLEAVSSGEKLSLARRASGRVAGVLLLEADARIIRAALANPRMTEALITRALTRPAATSALVLAVCNHAKWSLRRDIRIALLRHCNTPLGFALEFAGTLPAAALQDVLEGSRLPQSVKNTLLKNRRA